MALLTLNAPQFRERFPAFADALLFPDATLQVRWDFSVLFISDNGSYGYLLGDRRQLGIELFMAHLLQLQSFIDAGMTTNQVASATVDKVTVSLTPPPEQTQFKWWLNQTSYGQQLNALLSLASVGGWTVGGSCQRAFR